MPRSIGAFSLILLESLRSLEEAFGERYAVIKGRSTPGSSISSAFPFAPPRRPFVADLFEFHFDFNYLAFLALGRKDTLSRSQLIRANVPLRLSPSLSRCGSFLAVIPRLRFRRVNCPRPPRSL